MVPIFHDQDRAVKEYEHYKVNDMLPKKFVVPDNLLLIGCHNYPYDSFFEEQMKEYKCEDYTCLRLRNIQPWSNTKRLRPYYRYLTSEKAKDKEYVIFVDTDDVFFSKSPDSILEIFLNEFDCDLLFNATKFWKGYWDTKPSFQAFKKGQEAHPDWFLNAGAYIGRKDFIIKVLERVLEFVTKTDLPAKAWYLREKQIKTCYRLYEEGKVDRRIIKLANLTANFPKGCGSDQAILRHIEHEFYPGLQIDTERKIFSRIGRTIDWSKKSRRRNVFIDCGGHYGQSMDKFKRSEEYKEADFEIYSFEPNFSLIQDYARRNPKDQIINAAVWIRDEDKKFYIDRKDGDGSSLLIEKKHPNGSQENDLKSPLTVKAIDFSSWILKNFKKDNYIILKMDIEGAEYAVLGKMIRDGSLEYVNKLYIEWHHEKVNIKKSKHETIMDKVTKICPNVYGEFKTIK